MPCFGNSSEECGGAWALGIYDYNIGEALPFFFISTVHSVAHAVIYQLESEH
jgi:hypothetical protein